VIPIADGYEVGSAFIRISPDTSDFAEQLEADVEEATAGAEGTVKIGADDEEFQAALDDAKAKLDELDGATATPELGIDKEAFDSGVEEAEERLSDFDGTGAVAELDLNKDEYDASMEDAEERLDEMDGKSATSRLDLDDDEFNEKLDEDKAKLASSNSESGEGSLLGAITMGVGSLVPGLGGAAAGLGLLGGTGALAFGGIASALDAAHQSSQNVGMTSAQTAAQQESDSVQIQQAQQSLGQAHEQAAQDAISSAQSIEQSQMNLASTERNASASQIQALQSVQQAEQGVQQATYNLSEANYNLGQAYTQAREAITQTNDALADAKLNVQSATLAVAQAQQNELLVDQNAYSTDLDRQQASLAVAQAKQQVTDATASETDAQTAANLSNQQGVSGSQTVIQAKEAQKQAVDGLTDANESQSDAVSNLSLTEINNAQQVKEAQLELSSTQEQAAYQQQQDAQNVANAQNNLTDTIQEQKLQWASMLSTQNSSANQFAKDFAALTPAGKKFVDQVLSMRGAFKQLENAAQNATLPGFTTFLDGISDLMPTIQSGVTQMGGAISNAFAGFGKEMESPEGTKVLQGLVSNGMQFVDTVLPAFGQFFTQLGILGSKSGAVTGLADALAGIGTGLAGLAKGLTPYIPAFDQIFKAVGKITTALGPALAQDIGAIADALEPLAKFLNSKAGAPFIGAIAKVVAALLIFKGTMKLLPSFISDPLAKGASKIGDLLLSPFKEAAGKIPGLMSGAWSSVNQGWLRLSGKIESGLTSMEGWVQNTAQVVGSKMSAAWTGASGWVSTFASNVGSKLSTAGTAVAEFASNFGSKMMQAGSSAVQFVTTLGAQLVEAASKTWTWIAENASAAASYIAENVAEAASATAAFIMENAASLGLVAALTAVVGGIIYLATHWQQSWTDIKNWAEDAWNFIYNGFGKYLLPLLGPAGLIALGVIELAQHWNSVWGGIKSTFDTVTGAISTGAHGFVSGLSSVWGTLENTFEKPVNFLITKVYDDGIRNFWNDIVGAVGLGSLDLPKVAPLAHGGVLPGYSPGRDTVPAMLSPGEAVLTPGATRAIGGAATVNALNAAHAPSGGRSGGSKFADGGLVRHFGFGGLLGDAGSFFSGAAHDVTSFLGGAVTVAKIVGDLASGNTAGVTSELGKFVSTDAAGDLAKVMVGIPKTLATDLVKSIVGKVTGGGGSGGLPGGSSTATGSLPQNYRTIASFLASNGFTKFAAAGVAGNVDAESGGNPEILEIGGGGGGGLIQWTPYPPGYITGNVQQDLMTQLNAILSWGGGPGIVNRASSPSNAAELYQDYYEKPANLSASLPTRMSSANAVYKAMGWGSFDQGGILPPGPTLTVNGTGQPEAVLNPQQTQWLQQAAQHGADGAQGAPVVVNNTFTGSQFPGVQQLAELNRQLAMTLGGA
jgi:Phage tail lysozyme